MVYKRVRVWTWALSLPVKNFAESPSPPGGDVQMLNDKGVISYRGPKGQFGIKGLEFWAIYPALQNPEQYLLGLLFFQNFKLRFLFFFVGKSWF